MFLIEVSTNLNPIKLIRGEGRETRGWGGWGVKGESSVITTSHKSMAHVHQKRSRRP